MRLPDRNLAKARLLLPRQLVAADCRGFLSLSLLYTRLFVCQWGCLVFFCVYNENMAKSRGRPPKDPDDVLSERIDIRITVAEKADFEGAAERIDASLSEWMRARLRTAARRDLRRQSGR